MLLCTLTALLAQDVNRLYVQDAKGIKGTTVTLSVGLDNTSTDIVGLQWDLNLPDGLTLDTESARLVAERSADHLAAIQDQGGGRYTFIVYSSGGKAIKGNHGPILSVKVALGEWLEEDHAYPVTLTNVVLTNAAGANLATGSADGSVTITHTPDFEVSGVQTLTREVEPESTIHIKWTVKNVGEVASAGGWSERVSLVSSTGEEAYLTTLYPEVETLAAGQALPREAEVGIPQIVGVDGPVAVKVEVVPNKDSGESSSLRTNNTAFTDYDALQVGKKLYLVMPAAVEEGTATTLRCKLTRSGSRKEALTFSNTLTGDGRLECPEQITLDAGVSSAYIPLTVIDNETLDEDSVFVITVTGNGYEPVEGTLVIVDDELPKLRLTVSKNEVAEGETFQLTVSTSRVSSLPIQVTLKSEDAIRLPIPETITIPAGEESFSIALTITDDEIPNVDASVAISAFASGYEPAETIVLIAEDDIPTLKLSFTPDKISEGEGPVSIIGRLVRKSHIDSKVTIKLTDDSNGGLFFGTRTLEMRKGVEQTTFQLGPVDNDLAEGDRTYNITASVYVSSCDCNVKGESAGVVTKPIQVFDNDGPALRMTVKNSTIKEGGNTTLTVTRNTTEGKELSVVLSSDNDDYLEYKHTVTIPAGEQTIDVEVLSKANHSPDAKELIVFTAKAEGYSQASCLLMVTDQTKPDARIAHLAISPGEMEAGDKAKAMVTIENKGNAPLPALTCIKIYAKNNENALVRLYVQEDLPAEGSLTLDKEFTMPEKVGNLEIYAVVNEDHETPELSYDNNNSEAVIVNVLPAFTTIVSTDKSVYRSGEKVLISGKATGSRCNGAEVEVYIINNGLRTSLNSTTDIEGNFKVEYLPYQHQVGHFSVGSCYPEENATREQASFEVAGITLDNEDDIIEKITVNETTLVPLVLWNPCSISMTNVNIDAIGLDDDCLVEFDYSKTIQNGKAADIILKMTGIKASEGKQYKKFTIHVTSDEGAEMTKTVYYYSFLKSSRLVASEAKVNTTMTKGQTREYPIVITNQGKGSTGTISVLLPQKATWLSLATSQEMESLATGESTTVLLKFSPVENMQLNVPVTAFIALNCENGDGMQIPITLEPVSEEKGTLVIDVRDEYTYYTEEKPHLEGATVKVTHPTLGTLLAEGITDANGLFETNLNEGYYTISVTAERHDQYRGNLLVDPGRITNKVVNLSIQGVSITWDVVETEVEDQYNIVTNVTYETHVPAPVVVLTGPEKVDGDAIEPGETMLLDFTLTNYGLVKALDVTFMVPEPSQEWLFSPLAYTEPFDLGAEQTVHIPVLLTKLDGTAASQKYKAKKGYVPYLSPCMGGFEALYGEICGEELKKNKALWRLSLKTCGWSAILIALADQLWKGGPNTGIEDGGFTSGLDELPWVNVKEEDTFCNPDLTKMVEEGINYGLGLMGGGPLFDAFNGGMDLSLNSTESNGASLPGDLLNYLGEQIGGAGAEIAGPGAEILWGVFTNICSQASNAAERMSNSGKKEVKKLVYDWMRLYDENLILMARQIEACKSALLEMFGDPAWLGHFDLQTAEFYLLLGEMFSGDSAVDMAKLQEAKPDYVTMEKVRKFVERMENTSKGLNVVNAIHIDSIAKYKKVYNDIDAIAKGKGFGSMMEMFDHSCMEFMKHLEEASHSMCASVTLQFEQTLVMTRQAFRGFLNIYNGHDDTPMTDVKLHLVVKDDEGHLATSREFQINLESLEHIKGDPSLESLWTIDAKEKGKASILFIPTKYAAVLAEKTYSFGGFLEYVDPYTGLTVTKDLLPVTLTVKPSPELDLVYFMQRDILGDNPFTSEVEKSEPAEFALIINNKGYGDAKDVRMVTSQPKIVENEKGLLVDFELLGSQVNGGETNLAFGQSIANDFGDINSHSQAYAQWWLQSSLLGHFIDYDVQANHLTSYGNENLSLLGNTSIHELIRSVCVPETSHLAFIVNDVIDYEDFPDMAYLTDGSVAEVQPATSVSISRLSSTEYKLIVGAPEEGWVYGKVADPTGGSMVLTGITRNSDGQEISLRNIWQTYVTLHDGADPIYENLIHVADLLQGTYESYTLTFEPKTTSDLRVAGFVGIPEEGETAEKVKEVTVNFNKNVEASTFTTEDVTLTHDGIQLENGLIGIVAVDEATFVLDFSKLTSDYGYYVLTVSTKDILDVDGMKGITNTSAAWIQYDPMSIKDIADNRWSIFLQDGNVIIHSDTDMRLPVLTIDGRLYRVMNIPKGMSIHHGFIPGVYILKDKKMVIPR